MRIFITMFAVFAAAFSLSAAELFKAPGVTALGGGEYEFVSAGKRSSGSLVAVSPGRSYILSGEFKAESGTADLSFGLEVLDKQKRPIQPHMVRFVPGTETAVMADAEKGDKTLLIGSKWSPNNGRIVVFDAKKDLSDLPNRRFGYYIDKCEPEGENWKLTLSRPLPFDVKAGTLVRQHADGHSLHAAHKQTLGNEWRTFRKVISPGARYAYDSSVWWPAVRYARIFMLAPAGGKIRFRKLTLAPVPVAAFSSPLVKVLGNGEFEFSSQGKRISGSALFRIDPSRHYFLSGEFRAEEAVKDFSFGLELFDREGRPVNSHMVRYAAGSETQLRADAKKGDTTLLIGAKWPPPRGRIVVFDAKKDLSDLPNRRFAYYITKGEPENGNWKLTLSRPLPFDVKAGTLVRQHGDGFLLCAANKQPLGKAWQAFRHLISPGAKYTVDSRFWWPGAGYARVFLQAPAGAKIRFRKLAFNQAREPELSDALKAREEAGVTPVPFGKFSPAASGRGVRLESGKGGFFIPVPALPPEKLRQVEMRLSAGTPGMLRLFWNGVGPDGKTLTLQTAQPVIPDGEYRRYIFPAPENLGEFKTVNALRLLWHSDAPVEIDIRTVNFRDRVNLIPGAPSLEAGETRMLEYLRPRCKYRFIWTGGKSPGAVLVWLDRDDRELGTLTLEPGKNAAEFTMPEQALRAKLRIAGTAAGYPVLEPVPAAPAPAAMRWRGKWIWCQRESGPEHTAVWLEREFELPDGPVDEALLAVAADDWPQIFINGEPAGAGGTFMAARRFEVAKFLKPGKNVLTVKVTNYEQQGGLLCDLYCRVGGRDIYVSSDEKWKLHVGGSGRPERIDAPVMVIGGEAEKTPPWSGRLDRCYAGPRGKWKILETAVGAFTAEELLPVPVMPRFLRAKAVGADGSSRAVMLDAEVERSGRTVKVSYPKLFSDSDKPQTLYLDEPLLTVVGAAPVGTIPGSAAPAGLSKARYTGVGGRTRLVVGGKEYSPCFWAFNTSFKRNPMGDVALAAEARDAGFKNFTLLTDFPEFWLGPGKYDFSKLDERAGILLDICPDAVLLLQIGCWMPDWWLKENPDDVTRHADGSPLHISLERQALSSEKWIRDAEAPLRALVRHIKSRKYGRRIWGASVSEGTNWEWFWTVKGRNDKPAVSGFAPADFAAFRNYLRRKYKTDAELAAKWRTPGATFDTAEMPPPAKQIRGSVGTLLDPERDQQLVDWFEYRNLSVASAVTGLCRIIKEESGNNWLTGAYYGYFVEMASNIVRAIQDHGHNAVPETAKSPYIDFVRAPIRYKLRRIGRSDGIMHPQDQYLLNGKAVYIECDHRTAYRQNIPNRSPLAVSHPATGFQTVTMLDRAFGTMLASGASHYWYDITRAAFREPLLQQLLRDHNELCMKLPPVRGYTPRDLALVVDRDSANLVKRNAKNTLLPAVFDALGFDLNRIGAAHRVLSVDELIDGKSPAHRFYIMAATLLLDKERRAALMRRFDAEKATVLWLYAPGAYYPGSGPKAEYCGDFLGLKMRMETSGPPPALRLGRREYRVEAPEAPWFYAESGFDRVLGCDAKGTPLVVSVRRGGANHIFSTLPSLPVDLLRKLAAEAGAHLYTPDADDPVWVGNDVVFLHAVKGGKKRIMLRKGTRLRGIVGPHKGKTFSSGESWTAEAGRTCGFLVEAE